MLDKIETVLKDLFTSLGHNPDYAKVSVSNRPELCDYQVNGVFAIAKDLGANPKEIGEDIVSKINNLDKLIEEILSLNEKLIATKIFLFR